MESHAKSETTDLYEEIEKSLRDTKKISEGISENLSLQDGTPSFAILFF
jgi:hypothetical protein